MVSSVTAQYNSFHTLLISVDPTTAHFRPTFGRTTPIPPRFYIYNRLTYPNGSAVAQPLTRDGSDASTGSAIAHTIQTGSAPHTRFGPAQLNRRAHISSRRIYVALKRVGGRPSLRVVVLLLLAWLLPHQQLVVALL